MTHEEFIKNALTHHKWYIEDGVLYVNGSLSCSQYQYLPDNISIGGQLNLEYSSIKTLPKGLIIKHHLWLYGSKITALPDDLILETTMYCGTYSLIMCEELQIKLISYGEFSLGKIKNPTEKAKALYKLLYRL